MDQNAKVERLLEMLRRAAEQLPEEEAETAKRILSRKLLRKKLQLQIEAVDSKDEDLELDCRLISGAMNETLEGQPGSIEHKQRLWEVFDVWLAVMEKEYGFSISRPSRPFLESEDGKLIQLLKGLHGTDGLGCEREPLRAEAYLYNKGTQGCLERSCWQPKHEEEVWYACYGSNLSEERFRCYVQGGVAPNGNRYYGCNDTTLWKESYWTDYRGRLYFGNKSPSWDYDGVAFYDPAGHEPVLFRLYRITRNQLHDIMRQEGSSANWYGHQLLLGMGKDNLPVYTLISSTTRPQKAPSPNYLEVIRTALEKEAGLKPKEVKRYLNKALNA